MYKLTNFLFLLFTSLSIISFEAQAQSQTVSFFAADDPHIQYTGRIDFSNPILPRIWQPGVYITVSFTGSYFDAIINDEVLWGKNQNYLEVVLDGKPVRLQTKGKTDTINIGRNLSPGKHTLVICKNTEANIGYIELAGFYCEALTQPPARPKRKIEFIGDSITCGTGSDMSVVNCGKGVWQDQHNAYLSYGPVTARKLKAQYHLSAVSGVGLMHSCCNMDIIMPQVFDKISMRNDTIEWDFKKFQPDVVTICLGQNDGVQDSAEFCKNYISFLRKVRMKYRNANVILLTSPMADEPLTIFMKKMLSAIAAESHRNGDVKIHTYFFTRSYTAGCDYHPSLQEHALIAAELSTAIKKIMHW
jgi:lysophospholipase L1-like esterase